MRHKTKIIFLFLLIIFLTLSLTGCDVLTTENKIQIPNVLQDTYVYDQGNFIDDNIEQDTNKFLIELEEKTEIEFVVITVPSLNNLTIEEYANQLANSLGIGKEKEDNGILLLVSKSDSKVRLEIGDGLQGILTDSISGRILDNYFVPHRDEDNYNQAVFDTVQATINVISSSEEYNFEIAGIDSEKTVSTLTDEQILLIVLVIVIVLVILEFLTGYIFGDGFGDGIVFAILSSTGSSSGSFGGGHFRWRRRFEIKKLLGGLFYEKRYRCYYCNSSYSCNIVSRKL